MPSVGDVLTARGLDYPAALARFSDNEELLHSFLMEFPGESYLQNAQDALEQGDMAAYQTAVHVVTGTAGSLGMTALYGVSAAMMTALRTGNTEEAKALHPRMTAEYQNARQAILDAFSQ